MWVSQQNVTHKLSDTLFDEAFSGDGYEVSLAGSFSLIYQHLLLSSMSLVLFFLVRDTY